MDLTQLAREKITFRRKVFKLFGQTIFGLDQSGRELFFVKLKAFKLREDIRAFSDKEMTDELLYIQARQILDFSAAYDVVDSKTNERVGTLRRRGLKSAFLRDEWQILDAQETEIGLMQEDSTLMALVRRFLVALIPQKYDFIVGGKSVAKLRQRFNPFIFKADYECLDPAAIEPKLALAGAILLMCIEGRQE